MQEKEQLDNMRFNKQRKKTQYCQGKKLDDRYVKQQETNGYVRMPDWPFDGMQGSSESHGIDQKISGQPIHSKLQGYVPNTFEEVE